MTLKVILGLITSIYVCNLIASQASISSLSSESNKAQQSERVAPSEPLHQRNCCQRITNMFTGAVKTVAGKFSGIMRNVQLQRRLQVLSCISTFAALYASKPFIENASDTFCTYDPCCVTESSSLGAGLRTLCSAAVVLSSAKSAYTATTEYKQLRKNEQEQKELHAQRENFIKVSKPLENKIINLLATIEVEEMFMAMGKRTNKNITKLDQSIKTLHKNFSDFNFSQVYSIQAKPTFDMNTLRKYEEEFLAIEKEFVATCTTAKVVTTESKKDQ